MFRRNALPVFVPARTALRLAALLLAALPWLTTPCVAGQTGELWVAFGDSLTASQKWPWTEILAQETGNTVINSGHNRTTTRNALRFLKHDVLDRKPDLVLVMFGINDQRIPNDARPGAYEVPPEEYARNLDTIITRVQATGARVVLLTNRPLVQGPGAPTRNFYLDRNGGKGALYTLPRKTKDSIQLYNDIVRAKAREHGAFLVDIWKAVVNRAGSDRDEDVLKLGLDRPGDLLDGVHLGPGGARFYSDTIRAAMPFR